jgi:hypothetical protein
MAEITSDPASQPLSHTTRAYLLFTGTGPILVLSTYPDLSDDRLVDKLRYKGIDRFLAYEVSLDAVRQRYSDTFGSVAEDLAGREDLRVLDFNGHQIMANFSLDELGEPVKIGG